MRARCLMRIGVVALMLPVHAAAGPPLISDDPNTIGPGAVQPIFSTVVIAEGGATVLDAPLADLTVGIVDTLDFTLITTLRNAHDTGVDPPWAANAVFTPGLKWELFERERGSLAFSPAFVVNARVPKRSAVLLPLQGELAVGSRGRGIVGFDVGYEPQLANVHRWFVIPYARYSATPKLDLLYELWCIGAASSVNLGGSMGIDYGILGNDVRLLAAISTAFVSFDAPRINARAYVGVQYNFTVR